MGTMRDSINYNLKIFIMKMSGTKPMKNTMRKSPLKQGFTAPNPAKKAIDTVTALSKKVAAKKATTKSAPTTKPAATEGKPARPTVKAKVNLEKTPAMQMKKSKC